MPLSALMEGQTISPVYWSNVANEAIELGRDKVTVVAGNVTVTGKGVAVLEFTPRERVVVSVTLDGSTKDHHVGFGDKRLSLQFGDDGQPTKVLCIRSSMTDQGIVKLQLIVQSGRFTICRNRRVKLAQVVLHVVNFPRFSSVSPESNDYLHRDGNGGSARLGRVVMDVAEWRIEVHERPGTKALTEQLNAEGGHATTHFARITRIDGRFLSVKEAEQATNLTHLILSFARGHSTPIFGAVGFNREGSVGYRQWAQLPSTPWIGRSSWFDIHHAEALSELVDGFERARHDQDTGRAFSAALYWYLRSNRGGDGLGVDGAVILSQAALEGLSKIDNIEECSHVGHLCG